MNAKTFHGYDDYVGRRCRLLEEVKTLGGTVFTTSDRFIVESVHGSLVDICLTPYRSGRSNWLTGIHVDKIVVEDIPESSRDLRVVY